MKSFLSKKSILRTMAVAAVCMLGATSVKAQEFTTVSYTHLTLPTNSRV